MIWHRLISNDAEDNKCYQACIQMIYESFFGVVPTELIDEMTGYEAGKWTWPFQGFKFLADSKLEVCYIDRFSAKDFTSDPVMWLQKSYSRKDADTIMAKSDIIESAKALDLILNSNRFQHISSSPNLETIKEKLDQNCRVLVGVNSRRLNRKEGYAGHFVLINRVNKHDISIADPGLPANIDRQVDTKTFVEAWNYPNDGSGWMAAIRAIEV